LLTTGFVSYGLSFPLIVWVLLEISGAREPASAWSCFISAGLLVTAPLAVGWRFVLTHYRLRQR
jgi:hypothetical protein